MDHSKTNSRRAQLGIGEVHMALRNFEKGVHLDPSDQEMWSDDLHWAWGLAKEKEKREKEVGNKDDEN
ncbi:Tetratricopeptide repeat protein 33 [Geodia barretti]|uniref:Tetratricopeptide repeat protein 33 n=1 Tax=Geodia barretti TaxID=519541 RepID=A0AA35SIW6_GEOBA|nr:Tetratricopeptide repeat protein 33 [Geodia barretti]